MDLTKQAVWRKVHMSRAECPLCHKSVTLRTLRWRHKCRVRRPPRPTLLTEPEAAHRKELIRQRAVEQLITRLENAAESDGAMPP
jgi:hypothetical protein